MDFKYARLTRDYDVIKAQYNELVSRLDRAKISDEAEQTGVGRFEVIDPPSVNIEPVAPNRPRLIALVLLVGLLAGFGLAFVLNQTKPVFDNVRARRRHRPAGTRSREPHLARTTQGKADLRSGPGRGRGHRTLRPGRRRREQALGRVAGSGKVAKVDAADEALIGQYDIAADPKLQAEGGCWDMYGMTIDLDGNPWFANRGCGTVIKVDGRPGRVMSVLKGGPDGLNGPRAAGIDTRGHVWVSENGAYQRLAEQDLARREFLTNVAHELRTPLMAASGYLQMLQRGVMNGEQLQVGIEAVARNVQHIVTLVNDILFLQEMELVLPEFQAVDMAEVARQVTDRYTPRASEHGVRLRLNLDPSLPAVLGDPKSLERALTALLDNAIKFSPQGGDVNIRLFKQDSQVIVTIEDHGIGIEKENLKRIFDRFYHLEKSGDALFGGIGPGGRLRARARGPHARRAGRGAGVRSAHDARPGAARGRRRRAARTASIGDRVALVRELAAALAPALQAQQIEPAMNVTEAAEG